MYRQEEPEINIDKLIARLKSMFGFLGKDGDGDGSGPECCEWVRVSGGNGGDSDG